MKKFAAVLLALVLLCSLALAETKEYVHRDGYFSAQIPADAIVLNGDTMSGLFESEAYQQYLIDNGMTREMVELALSASGDAEMVLYGDGNLNCMYAANTGITAELLPLFSSLLDSVMLEEMKNMGVPSENVEFLGIQTYGDYAFYTFHVSMAGMNSHSYAYYDSEGNQISLSFTDFDPVAERLFLESFKPL